MGSSGSGNLVWIEWCEEWPGGGGAAAAPGQRAALTCRPDQSLAARRSGRALQVIQPRVWTVIYVSSLLTAV